MFDPQVYREACGKMTVPQDKLEEMIVMTQAKEKKVRRPFRAALIAAAAVAMMVVGVGAANPEAVQELFVQIATVVRVDEYRQEMVTSAEQWEITVSMEEEGKQVGSFTTSSEENALAPGQVQDNYSVNEGVEISKAGEELNKEICVSEYDGETATVIPVK